MDEDYERYENRFNSGKFRFIIVITLIISFFAGFCTHTLIGVKRSEYDGLLLYYDSILEKVTKLEDRVSSMDAIDDIDKTSTKPNEESNETAAPKNTGEYVWITKSGEKYHKEDCGSLKENSEKITLEQALSTGKEPCKICYK